MRSSIARHDSPLRTRGAIHSANQECVSARLGTDHHRNEHEHRTAGPGRRHPIERELETGRSAVRRRRIRDFQAESKGWKDDRDRLSTHSRCCGNPKVGAVEQKDGSFTITLNGTGWSHRLQGQAREGRPGRRQVPGDGQLPGRDLPRPRWRRTEDSKVGPLKQSPMIAKLAEIAKAERPQESRSRLLEEAIRGNHGHPNNAILYAELLELGRGGRLRGRQGQGRGQAMDRRGQAIRRRVVERCPAQGDQGHRVEQEPRQADRRAGARSRQGGERGRPRHKSDRAQLSWRRAAKESGMEELASGEPTLATPRSITSSTKSITRRSPRSNRPPIRDGKTSLGRPDRLDGALHRGAMPPVRRGRRRFRRPAHDVQAGRVHRSSISPAHPRPRPLDQ